MAAMFGDCGYGGGYSYGYSSYSKPKVNYHSQNSDYVTTVVTKMDQMSVSDSFSCFAAGGGGGGVQKKVFREEEVYEEDDVFSYPRHNGGAVQKHVYKEEVYEVAGAGGGHGDGRYGAAGQKHAYGQHTGGGGGGHKQYSSYHEEEFEEEGAVAGGGFAHLQQGGAGGKNSKQTKIQKYEVIEGSNYGGGGGGKYGRHDAIKVSGGGGYNRHDAAVAVAGGGYNKYGQGGGAAAYGNSYSSKEEFATGGRILHSSGGRSEQKQKHYESYESEEEEEEEEYESESEEEYEVCPPSRQGGSAHRYHQAAYNKHDQRAGGGRKHFQTYESREEYGGAQRYEKYESSTQVGYDEGGCGRTGKAKSIML